MFVISLFLSLSSNTSILPCSIRPPPTCLKDATPILPLLYSLNSWLIYILDLLKLYSCERTKRNLYECFLTVSGDVQWVYFHVLNALTVYVGDRLHKGPWRDAKCLKRGLSCVIKKVGILFAYACVWKGICWFLINSFLQKERWFLQRDLQISSSIQVC